METDPPGSESPSAPNAGEPRPVRPGSTLSGWLGALDRADWLTAVLAAAVAIAIWIPTMAVVPRYSDTESGSPWLFPLLSLAALVLAALRPRSWSVVAPALVVPLLLVAPFTAPRGDTTGLWVFTLVFLAAFGGVLFVVAWCASRPSVTRWARAAAAMLTGAVGAVLLVALVSSPSSGGTGDSASRASWCSFAKYTKGTPMVEIASSYDDFDQVWWLVRDYGHEAPPAVAGDVDALVSGIGAMRGQPVPRVASPSTLAVAARVDAYVVSTCAAS